jgi:pimeloyl-ACP methyl ester carboxylesterase
MQKISDHLYPFESHWLDLDGLRYHYLDEGDGEVVVAVHGNPTWSFYYRDLVKALSNDWRVVVPDHMGCGLSDKPSDEDYDYTLSRRILDIGALMDDLDHTDINLEVH